MSAEHARKIFIAQLGTDVVPEVVKGKPMVLNFCGDTVKFRKIWIQVSMIYVSCSRHNVQPVSSDLGNSSRF
jgi:hypothetical protein